MTTPNETIQTLETLAPTVLNVAAAASGNPAIALVAQATPVAIQAIEAFQQLHAMGVVSADQLAGLWQTVSSGVQSAHSQWAAMNTQDK